MIIDGNVYKANTNTQRKEVSSFVNRFKKQAIFEKVIKKKVASAAARLKNNNVLEHEHHFQNDNKNHYDGGLKNNR